MKKRRPIFTKLILSIMMISTIITLSSCQNKGTKINFASYKTAEKVPYDIYFDETYFDNPASEYNPKLASATACLALAGFSATAGTDYQNSDTNIKAFFDTLGFEKYQANEYGVSKPTTDSFGVYIASKKISDFTLIGIGVRGAGYQSEWASNFKISKNENFAQGFYEASEIYLNFLKEYIATNNISGKIKIWTGGYSRGGATVNLAAGRIDDGLINNLNIISQDVNYTKDDIYAYCFEPPAGKIATLNGNEIKEKDENYSNIYSVMNLNDPVPFVAPVNFGFVRYGTDLFLPDIITDLNYQSHINRVKNRMSQLSNYHTIDEYKIDKAVDESTIKFFNSKSKYTNFSLYVYLESFINTLCKSIGSKDFYVDNFQQQITELFALLYASLKPKDSLINLGINFATKILSTDTDQIVLYDLQNNRSKFIKDLNVLVYNAIKTSGADINVSDAMKLLKNIINTFVDILLSSGGFATIRPLLNVDNIKAIGSAHIPELLLSHITALDSNYEGENLLQLKTTFNKLYVNTTSNFELIINDQKYVYFENDEIKSKLVTVKNNDGYLIYLPSDAEFKFNSSDIKYELYNCNNKFFNDTLIKSN